MVIRLADLDNMDKEEKKTGLVRLKDLNQMESQQRQQQFSPTRQDVFNSGSTPSLKLNPVTVNNTIQNRIQPAPPPVPTRTLQEDVQPFRMQQPDLVKDYTSVSTPNQRREQWVEDRLEQDARGAASNPILRTINTALEPISRGVYNVTSHLAPLQQGAGSALGIKADTAPYEPTVGNKAMEIGGMIGGSLTNPTNLSQGVASLGLRTGSHLAQKAGQASPVLNNRFAQRAIEGATAGAAQGALISGVRGETDAKELATNIGLGAALGGAGDLALSGLSSAARNIVSKYRSTPTQPQQNLLALPASRTRGNTNTAVTDDVITPEYQFKLPDADTNTTSRLRNVEEGRKELKVIDDEIRMLKADYERAIVEEYEFLRDSLANRQGRRPGQLIRDGEGNVISRVGWISDNPKWYRDFHAEFNKVPNRKELYNLAKKRVDEGFEDETGFVPGWKMSNNYDDTIATLQDVQKTLRSSVRELDPSINITNTPLVSSEVSFPPVRRPNRLETPLAKQAEPQAQPKVEPVQSMLTPPKESWFEKLFGRGGVGIAAGRGQSKELIDTHVTRFSKEKGPVIERIKDAASIAEQDYIDKFAPFKALDDNNITYDATMDSTRANNLANVAIKDKFVDLEGNVRGNSLKDVYSVVPRGQKDLAERYIIMRDAIDRMDRMITVYDDKPWFPKTSQEAAERVAKMEVDYPWVKQFGEEWNQFNRNRQDLWVESGLVSQELIDTLRHTNPNYTPMQRQMPSLGLRNAFKSNKSGMAGQKADINKAVGSKRKIIEPAQSMINSTANSYHAMLRNRAMQKLYDAVVADPEKYRGIIEIVPEDDAARQVTLKQINDIINEDGIDGLADMLNSEMDSLFTKSKQSSARPTDNHVTVMINGQPVKMNVQEKSLLRAIEGVSPERLEGILRIADTLSRGVKISATGALAPLQGVKLFARDIPVAFAQSKDKLRFMSDISHAMISQVADWLPEFVPGAQNLGRLAREYYRAGGGYEQYLRGDSRIRATAADITRDPLLSGRNILKQVKKTQLGLRPFKELGDAFENIPRIAAFQAAMRRSGWSRDEASIRQALNEAREATVNWSRKGARGQQIESVLPYSNAAVQGTYRMAKFLREQPVSALSFITAAAGATIGAYEKFKDDPDYQNRSKFAKGIPVYKTEDGKFVTIPTEPAYQYIADQVLNFYKWAKDQEELPPVRETIQEGFDALTPKYIAGPVSTFTGDKAVDPARGVSTTLGGSSLEPVVATATGKNYYGGDIVPREYQSNSTPFQQNETTSAAANWAAENLGMDAFTFDYLAQKFGGDLAKVTLPMTSQVGRGDPTGNIVDETLARLQLLEDPVMKNKLGDEWYKYADKVTQAKADSSKADTDLPSWYQEVYDKVTSSKKGSIAKAITDLNSEKKSIQRDVSLTAKQRSEQLRSVQTEINLLRIKGIEIMEKAGVLQ